jgi:hypothetical protein
MGMAHKIADLTLDEVILHLIAGDVLAVTGGKEFSLSLADSRAILSCNFPWPARS